MRRPHVPALDIDLGAASAAVEGPHSPSDASAWERRGRIVAMACSVGGPTALDEILRRLPVHFPVPIVVAQHMAEGFIDGLAEWLDARCPLEIRVARDGDSLRPGLVLLAPHDRHVHVATSGGIVLSDAPPVSGFRPAGTVLYETVAQVYGPASVAVILTGLGSDGVQGLRTIRHQGGRILAQDPDTAVAFGMPGAAVEAGLCDDVLPLGAIATRLQEVVS